MKLKAILVATSLLAVPTFASAQETTTSVYAGVTSDYLWRGATQSAGKESAFAGVDVTSGAFYLGAWAGGVDFGGEANIETDVYASFKPSLGPVALEFGILGYLYPQETALNTYEGKVAATYTLKNGLGMTGAVYYSPDVASTDTSSTYYEIGAALPLSGKIGTFSTAIGASAGKYDFEVGNDYDNVKVYFTATSEKGWGVEFGATDTDAQDPTGYVTLKKSF
jgi:uncharacterized protein (TIGR02001 family)